MKALSLTCIFCLSFFFNTLANDTLANKPFKFIKFDLNLNIKNFKVDTIDNFFLKDIFFNSSFSPLASLGNVASPIFALSPSAFFHSGFEFLPNGYKNYFFIDDEIYFLNKAITSLKFSLGSKREQNISFFHSQNFGKRLNFFARSQNFRSDGFYRNQTSKSNCFEMGFSLVSKNNKLFTNALISISKIYNRENGGLIDTSFSNEINLDKGLLDVNLLQASNSFRQNSFTVSNKYFMKDYGNLFSDSIVSKFNFYHKFIFEEIKRNYVDSLADDFYGVGNYSSVSSTDFIYNRKIENNFGVFSGDKFSYFNVWLSNPINYVSTYFERIHNAGFDLNLEAVKTLNLFLTKFVGKYFLNNYNRGDYSFNVQALKSSKNDKLVIGLSADLLESSPFIFYNKFFSNRNNWTNSFEKERFLRFGFTSKYRNILSLDLDYFSLKNLIIFDEFNKPVQIQDGLVNYVKLTFSANLSSKRIFSKATIVVQNPLNNTVDLNFPTFFVKEKFRLLFNSFKRNLTSGIGFDAIYSSATNGWGYLPSISVFTLNNNFSVMAYPRLDFVYDFKVRNLEGFVRVDNFLSGFTQELYYTLDSYPMPDRTIRFGIIWTFIDDKFIEKKQ